MSPNPVVPETPHNRESRDEASCSFFVFLHLFQSLLLSSFYPFRLLEVTQMKGKWLCDMRQTRRGNKMLLRLKGLEAKNVAQRPGDIFGSGTRALVASGGIIVNSSPNPQFEAQFKSCLLYSEIA